MLGRYAEAEAACMEACKQDGENDHFEANLQQVRSHEQVSQQAEWAVMHATEARLEVENLQEMVQSAMDARAEAEQQAQGAKQRARAAEKLARDMSDRHLRIQLEVSASTLSNTSPMSPMKNTVSTSITNYDLIKCIGKGATGEVWAARCRSSKQLVAVKSIHKNCKASTHERIVEEKNIMEQLDAHPYIVGLLAAFQDTTALHFVQEFMSGGDLFSYMDSRLEGKHPGRGFKLTNEEATVISATLALAIVHLHKHRIVHRSMHP
jgi:hypothetical protein